MSRFIPAVKAFIQEEDGITAIEYGLIAALVGVAIVTGATLLGGNLNTLFSAIGNKLNGITVP
jgi:pilus assembly protein Flp/PilA